MEITCPHCNFTREVDQAKIPDRPVTATCPRCRQPFGFAKTALTEAGRVPEAAQTAAGPEPAAQLQVSCPACGLEQPAGENCVGCGVNFAMWEARQQTRTRQDIQAGGPGAQPATSNRPAEIRHAPSTLTASIRPKAGFWIRFFAYGIDGAIIGAIQILLGLLFDYLVGFSVTLSNEGQVAMAVVSGLMSISISFCYGIFFIGYCGQTPGKMLVRVKVIRTDGSALSYGQAFLREFLGKFVSGILLGIGYLMVAFDSQKQGLHDKIADTYVIRI